MTSPTLRNLESPFILWIQIDIYFLASTSYPTVKTGEGLYVWTDAGKQASIVVNEA